MQSIIYLYFGVNSRITMFIMMILLIIFLIIQSLRAQCILSAASTGCSSFSNHVQEERTLPIHNGRALMRAHNYSHGKKDKDPYNISTMKTGSL